MKRLLLAAALALAPTLACVAPALADSPQHLVDSSTLALEDLVGGSSGGDIKSALRHAKAVVICPDIFRGGLVFGGEGGGCVMSGRSVDGSWSYPALYNLGSGSFGLQIGVQNSEVIMLIMSDKGLNALLNSQFKFGGDAGVSVATFGTGVNGSMTTALNTDIISYSKSQGLYGGVSLAGSVLGNDSGAQQSYYGTQLDARQIVVDGQGSNPGSNPLRTLLGRYSQ
jgi:SH3 domain-containing YSC84-like protein 1